jgi:hypothetical protein
MNISGTLNVFRLIRDPTLCLPQHTVATFNHLPVPLSKAFPKQEGKKDVDIQAVVLDKDNCFAVPHTDEVHKPYHVGEAKICTFNTLSLCTFTYSPSIHYLYFCHITGAMTPSHCHILGTHVTPLSS